MTTWPASTLSYLPRWRRSMSESTPQRGTATSALGRWVVPRPRHRPRHRPRRPRQPLLPPRSP
eukprot:3032333-Prorocentrum_lima.AAC.1